MNEMSALEIARRFADLGDSKNACQAYALVIRDARGTDPGLEMEAAVYTLQNGGNYKVAYDSFLSLYKQGQFQEDCLSIMTQAFYEPNMKQTKKRYERNCKMLNKYPYLFRKDFPAFEELPIRFYPYDDNCYIPFLVETAEFSAKIDFKDKVITRNFFRDLERPILAEDVFSQYELEYLNDNVRHSEYVGRENHLYLHYTDWRTFCAHLQVLNLKPLTETKKVVFLIGNELEQYPIDFKERFGIDYSQYPVKQVGIREITKLIWHTQLSSHNGGDFFNEVMDAHPNIIAVDSLMMDNLDESVAQIQGILKRGDIPTGLVPTDRDEDKVRRLVKELAVLPNRSATDTLIMMFMAMADMRVLDPVSRIVPAILIQPHFGKYTPKLTLNQRGRLVPDVEQAEELKNSPIFKGFKYIKTFTPMRRPTTALAATGRFIWRQYEEAKNKDKPAKAHDEWGNRLLHRGYMVDPEDRLYRDSIIVRLEDGKLNARATFTALAAFLDIPYTESMTYCSLRGEFEPKQFENNVRGFDPASIYRTYDEFLGKEERYLLEFFLQDAYRFYGYDFHYYDGIPMTEERLEEMVPKLTGYTDFMREGREWIYHEDTLLKQKNGMVFDKPFEEVVAERLKAEMDQLAEYRILIGKVLLKNLRFDNENGVPLRFVPLLQPIPELMEQPLYH